MEEEVQGAHGVHSHAVGCQPGVRVGWGRFALLLVFGRSQQLEQRISANLGIFSCSEGSIVYWVTFAAHS